MAQKGSTENMETEMKNQKFKKLNSADYTSLQKS